MPQPETIQAIGNEIALRWDDGSESYYPMALLRALSPSAENIGERDLLGKIHGGDSRTEYPGVTVNSWSIVGSYAVQFVFSDGHNTGLYSFDYLQEIWDHLKKG